MYREIYFHMYSIDDLGTSARISILKRGHLGQSFSVEAGAVPFTKRIINNEENKIGGIYPTSAEIQLLSSDTFSFEDMYSADDTEFQILHYIDGKIDWIGYISPENFTEEDVFYERYLNLTCYDGLTRLKDIPFQDMDGLNFGLASNIFSYSFIKVIAECLLKTGFQLNIRVFVDRIAIVVPESTFGNVASSTLFDNGDIQFYPPTNHHMNDYQVGYTINYRLIDVQYEQTFSSKIVSIIKYAHGVVRLTLSTPFNNTTGSNPSFDIQVYNPANYKQSGNILQNTEHDVRIWLDPNPILSMDSDRNIQVPYFQMSHNAFDSWTVLNQIALAFDCRIFQVKGEWLIESLDIGVQEHTNSFSLFNSQGNFIRNEEHSNRIIIPYIPSETAYRLSGNVRYIDKVLKRVSVQYKYRYAVLGDPLVNLIENGDFKVQDDRPTQATYTPSGWSRIVTGSPITFNIAKRSNALFGSHIEISTPQTFNDSNRLRSRQFRVLEGDLLFLSWYQRINEFLEDPRTYSYVTIIVTLRSDDDDLYYLVNYKEQEKWNDPLLMSPNPIAQWIAADKRNIIFHYNTNYATQHNFSNANGTLTPWSRVNISTLATPVSGIVTIDFVGSTRRLYRNRSSRDLPLAWSYALDVEKYIHYGNIEYIEDNRAWPENVKFYKASFNPLVHLADVKITKITSQQHGDGRIYEYEQQGNYVDTLTNISIPIGDENSLDHMSIIKYQNQPLELWVDAQELLGVSSFGMLLAKSIARRYLKPYQMIDGGFSHPDLQFNSLITFEDDPTKVYMIKNGDIHSKEHIFQGTISQIGLVDLPGGGIDYGPNSLSGTASRTQHSPGVRLGGNTNFVSQSTPISTLQRVTEHGNITNLDIHTRGTRNYWLLTVPSFPVAEDDELPDEYYLHTADDYLYINNNKIYAGDSDRWDGILKADYINQPIRTTDAPIFHGLTVSDQLTIPIKSNNLPNTLWKMANYLMVGAYKTWAGNTDLWNGLTQPAYIDQAVRTTDSPVFRGISSINFISGFSGQGYNISTDSQGDVTIETDQIIVRKNMSVYELQIQKIRATNGALWVSESAKIVQVSPSGNSFICTLESQPEGYYNPFVLNDVVRCQTFSGFEIKHYSARISAITSTNVTLVIIEGAGVPAEMDVIVRIGNTSNNSRQGSIYLSSSDDNAPYIDVLDGVSSATFVGKTKVRLGKLQGIIDVDFGSLAGYGLYTNNGYFKGTFIVQGGNAETIQGALQKANAVVETKDTRNLNELPAYYYSNFPKRLVREFKRGSVIGLPQTTYAQLNTYVPWGDSSGGAVIQECIFNNKLYTRSGTLTWSLWVEKETTDGSFQKADKALNDANIYTNTQVVVLDNKISLKADYEEFLALQTRVQHAEINLLPEQINLTVKSQIETISKQAVDAILIGGTNLISLNGAQTYNPYSSINKEFIQTEVFTHGTRITFTKNTSNANNLLTLTNGFTPMGTYTLSGRMFLNGNPFTAANFTRAGASSYNTSLASVFNFDEYGNFIITEEWLGTNRWIFHTRLLDWPVDEQIILENVKFEYGNKPSDWSPAYDDIEDAISATNTRIASSESSISQLANTIALKVDQAVVTQIQSRLSQAELLITPEKINLTVQNQIESKINGKILYRDPTFLQGLNSISIYNNLSNGNVIIQRESNLGTQPTGTPWRLKISNIGEAAPSLGGFTFRTPSRINAVFITKIIALIPVGWSINFATNSVGLPRTQVWLTQQQGTGKWEEYVFKLTCGSDGTFSTTNFFYLFGPLGTVENPVVWYVAFATVYDIYNRNDHVSKEEIKAGITISPNTINIFGETLNMQGMVTFSSLDPATQSSISSANSTASDALHLANTAQTSASNANSSAASANNILAIWKIANKTTINGGMIETGTITSDKINVTELFAQSIQANNLNIAGNSKIGKFVISGGSLIADGQTATDVAGIRIMSSNESLIASIGKPYSMASFAYRYMAYFRNHQSNSSENIALALSSNNSFLTSNNIALDIVNGLANLKSLCVGVQRISTNGVIINDNTTLAIAIRNSAGQALTTTIHMPRQPKVGRIIIFKNDQRSGITLNVQNPGPQFISTGGHRRSQHTFALHNVRIFVFDGVFWIEISGQ